MVKKIANMTFVSGEYIEEKPIPKMKAYIEIYSYKKEIAYIEFDCQEGCTDYSIYTPFVSQTTRKHQNIAFGICEECYIDYAEYNKVIEDIKGCKSLADLRRVFPVRHVTSLISDGIYSPNSII